jgi:integrase/recombinase XerD
MTVTAATDDTAQAVADFLDYIAAERGLSQNTRLAYGRDLLQFQQYCRIFHLDPLRIDLKGLRDFLAYLRKAELSARSMARKASAVKQFYRFLLREDRIESDPSELLTVLVKSRRLPKHLTIKEMFALLTAAHGDTDSGIRDRALLELWYATGCRITEIACLEASGIDWQGSLVRVRGKGGRERLIPVHAEALEWARRYRDVRHQQLARAAEPDTGVFFLNRRGKGFQRQGIWKIVKKYAKRAGIGRNIWPHMIRHSFATHILQGGADLRAVQELMGHRSIAATEVYTHLDIENLKLMQQKYHPRG